MADGTVFELPIDLNMVAKKLQLYKSEQLYVDVIAIPDKDFGIGRNVKSPRRLRLIDQSENKVILTLCGKDALNDQAIRSILHKPILIRNAIAYKHKLPFREEIQLSKELCEIRRLEDLEILGKNFKIVRRMEKLAAWYYQNFGQLKNFEESIKCYERPLVLAKKTIFVKPYCLQIRECIKIR